MHILFQNLGMNEKEQRAFLKMLELGAQPISVVARHVGVPRSSMYVILEKLKNLQVVEEFERGGITYVKCIPARQISDILKTKERTIEQTLKLLEESLPELEKLENKLSITPTVRFYEGKRAVMKMYEEVIRENGFHAFFNPAVVQEIMPEYYYKVGEMLKKNKGIAKELLAPGEEAQRYKKRFGSPTHEIKFLPKNSAFFADTLICKDTIYMISYGETEVSGTGIHNPSLAQAQRGIFEALWERI